MGAIETRSDPDYEAEGKETRLRCGTCAADTRHVAVRSVSYQSVWSEDDFSVTSWDRYQIVECQGCRTISFCHVHTDTENTDNDPRTGNEFLIEKVELYPKRFVGRQPILHVANLPSEIQRIYSEALDALATGLPVLTGIAIRTLIEAVCKERSASGRNLEERIDSLVSQGILTAPGAEVLHGLRLMGNRAAHEVKPHSEEDLGVAMDVVDYLLTGTYVLPQQAAKLPRRGTN